jgi:hypothetical protein
MRTAHQLRVNGFSSAVVLVLVLTAGFCSRAAGEAAAHWACVHAAAAASRAHSNTLKHTHTLVEVAAALNHSAL